MIGQDRYQVKEREILFKFLAGLDLCNKSGVYIKLAKTKLHFNPGEKQTKQFCMKGFRREAGIKDQLSTNIFANDT